VDGDGPNHVVVEPAAVQAIRAGTLTSARITAADGGDLVWISAEPGDALVVEVDDPSELASAVGQAGVTPVVVCALIRGEIRCFAAEEGTCRPLEVTVLPERADVFDRVRGVFETDVLRERSVAVLGLGSGGSVILRELARSGVGRFLLVDHDRLEIGNVCRHESGLSDVGRRKTNAAAEMVLDRNPAAEIRTLALKIGSDTLDELSAEIGRFGVDVVVCATDNRTSRLLVNRLCVLAGIPALYAGVFRRAYGGQVLRYLPGLSPCYQCFVNALPSMAADREVSSQADAQAIAYSDRPVAVEPGLASDIAPIALLVAKLTIQELLSGTPTTLDSLDEDLVAPLYLWLNRREAGTEYATWPPMATGVDEMSVLRWYGIELPRNEACSTCGSMAVEGVPADAPIDLSAFQASSE
jgi:molybdopterin/thiamine biosynthesis adenylyltransferase